MDTGSDGRFYDSHYDLNHDGFLNCGEQLLYEDDVFGHDDWGGGGYSRRRRAPKQVTAGALVLGLLYMFLFAVGFMIMIGCPPIGALIIVAAIHIKEKYL